MAASYTEIFLFNPPYQPAALFAAVARYLRQLAPLGNYVIHKVADEEDLIESIRERMADGARVAVLGGSPQLLTRLVDCIDHDLPMTVAAINGHLFEPSQTENALWLTELWSQTPHLFDYCHIGLKAHLVPADDLKLLYDLQFECMRFGRLLDHIWHAEPLLRQAHVLSFRPLALKGLCQAHDWQQELPPAWQDPVGLTVQQACQLMSYAGASGNSRLLHMPYPFLPAQIISPQAPGMIATCLWYWLEAGLNPLPGPSLQELDSLLYHKVEIMREHPLHFYEHIASGRWFIDLEDEPGADPRFIVPCTEQDFRLAIDHEPPMRYLRLSHRRAEFLRNKY